MADTQSALQLDEQNPWPGLAAYDEASARFFHGRDADITELLRLVKLSPFVAVYGKSGLGKSSMLQAGFFPRLRAERFLPVYLRLDFSERAAQPALKQAQERLRQEIEAAGADAAPADEGEGLWAYLQRREWPIWTADNFPLTPVLVFDQFEEVFSRGGSPEHVRAELELMADLVGDRLPAPLAEDREAVRRLNLQSQQYRVVLSFRSDFLAEVEAWEKLANLPRRESLHLTALSRERAVQAIELAGAAVIEPGVAERIVDFLLNREGGRAQGRATEVEPVLMSLCCTQLNSRRQRPAKIDAALLATVGEGILKGFYDEALHGMPPRVATFIEEHLIQGDRFRNPYALDGALESGALTQDELNALTLRRLLRVDPQGEVPRIELIHDRLVPVVREARDLRRAAEAQQRERERAEQLAREQREEAERQAQAQFDRERLALAERERVRVARSRNVLAGLVVLLAVALGGLFLALRKASDAEQEARSARDRAEQLADANAKARDDLQVSLQQAQDDLAQVKQAAVEGLKSVAEASGTVPSPSATRDVITAVIKAESNLRERKDLSIAAPAAAAPTAPVPAPVQAAAPSPSGAAPPASARTVAWRLSSGGCLKGDVTVTGEASFWIEPAGDSVIVRGRFEGKGNDGFTAVITDTGAKVPRVAQGSYEADTAGRWSNGRGREFQSAGRVRVYVADGVVQRASQLSFRTICPY